MSENDCDDRRFRRCNRYSRRMSKTMCDLNDKNDIDVISTEIYVKTQKDLLVLRTIEEDVVTVVVVSSFSTRHRSHWSYLLETRATTSCFVETKPNKLATMIRKRNFDMIETSSISVNDEVKVNSCLIVLYEIWLRTIIDSDDKSLWYW